jgi:hypothetical protein
VEYFAVFEGYAPALKDVNLPIHEAIELYILERLAALSPALEGSLSQEAKTMLMRLAKGDRKMLSIYKKEAISHFQGRSIYRQLFDANLIRIEKTRELPIKFHPRQRLKKSLRHYQAQDKIHFCNQFTRFWFTFIAPHENTKAMKAHLERQFDAYVSLAFEQLSFALLALHVNDETVFSQESYWDKRHEIDLLVTLKDGRVVAGESKWKNRRVCKNILTSLQTKCAYAGLHVDHFALFSKSGFSKELLRMEGDDVWLFDVHDFERLRDD